MTMYRNLFARLCSAPLLLLILLLLLRTQAGHAQTAQTAFLDQAVDLWETFFGVYNVTQGHALVVDEVNQLNGQCQSFPQFYSYLSHRDVRALFSAVAPHVLQADQPFYADFSSSSDQPSTYWRSDAECFSELGRC
jgi:hypothetical protein